jgi:WD40 repeat protein
VWDEESGELHRELEGSSESLLLALASFLSPDGQQPRLVAGSISGDLVIHDPEAGSVLHRLKGHTSAVFDVACIASSSAAPHHPRLVSVSHDRTAKVWDGETGEMLADLPGPGGFLSSVAVWKEHHGGHDRVATASGDRTVRVWDGEAFTLLHDLDCDSPVAQVMAFKSAEGPCHLVAVHSNGGGLQIWDPEEGRLLRGNNNRVAQLDDCHLFKSAEGRHLLAIRGSGRRQLRHAATTVTAFLDVWDLGDAPAATGHVRPAHRLG